MSAKLESSFNNEILDVPEDEVFSLDGVPNNEKQHKIFDMLMAQDELSWQNILRDLVKTEQMDPWDVDIKLLCDKFIETVKSFEKTNFNVSGKVLLAAAILLKMKAEKLLTSDIHAMDELIDFIESTEDELEGIDDELELELLRNEYLPKDKRDVLVPRTPQPRKRKVSVYDLVGALEKALESSYKRNITPAKKIEHKVPQKQKDITLIINEMYEEINKTLTKVKSLFFSELLVSDSREDKVNTFIPLLYLEGQRRIDLDQEEHFGDINIKLGKMAKEYGA